MAASASAAAVAVVVVVVESDSGWRMPDGRSDVRLMLVLVL